MMDLNQIQYEYAEACVKFLVESEINFHKKGGVTADRKLTIGGHKIPCAKCGGRNARRYIPTKKPVCEKCWNKALDKCINLLALKFMIKGTIEALYYGTEAVVEEKPEEEE